MTQVISRPVEQVEEIQLDNKKWSSKAIVVVALALVLGIVASFVAFGTHGGEPTSLAQIQAGDGLFGEAARTYLGHKQSLNFDQVPQSGPGNMVTYLEHKQRLND